MAILSQPQRYPTQRNRAYDRLRMVHMRVRWLETSVQDLRYGARELRRNPGFASTAIVSLALGIMAATAMYSVIYGVVLEPFPYRDVDNLVSIVLLAPNQRRYGETYTPPSYSALSP